MLSQVSSHRLQNDISEIASTLGKNLTVSLAATSESFAQECRAVVLRFGRGLKPQEDEIQRAASLYLRGKIGSDIDDLYDIVAFGLFVPVPEAEGQCVADDKRKLEILLARYREDARNGRLWEMTWFAVFQAYYKLSVRHAAQEALLLFLQETYPEILRKMVQAPLWLKIIAGNTRLLSRDPCRAYAEAWLSGEEHSVRQIASDLQIPAESWFWREMVNVCVSFVADKPDADFKRRVPKLLSLIEKEQDSLDKNLNAVLYRYNQCADKDDYEELKEFAVLHWGNPKLRHSINSRWLHVQEALWLMVLGWVKEDHSQAFFERISAGNCLGDDRLSVWLRYIAWTRIISAYEADPERREDPAMDRLFEAEDAVLSCADESFQKQRMEDFFVQLKEYAGGQG